jgi:hypothetical protein
MSRQRANGRREARTYDAAMPEEPALLDRERSPATAHTAMLDALVAGEGLERVAAIAAEHVGGTVAILVPRPGSDGADGTPAERYVAELVAGGDPERPPEVTDLAPIVSGGALQGAVVMLGGEDGAETGAYLGAAAVAALTGVAMLNAREDASRDEDELLADLLSARDVPPGEIVRRARLRGCDLGGGFAALCVNPGATPAGRVVATVAAERPDALVEPRGGRVHVLLPGDAEAARALAARLAEQVAASAHSSRYRQAGDARAALEEAELLLKLVEAGGRESSDRPTWDSLRLLFRAFVADPQELARFAAQTVGAVVRHDERHGSELEVTFWAYLESNCNMNLTAKQAFAHRHTISNRLARIEELTGLDPVRNYDRELLSLAFKAHLVVTMAPSR